jgi:hypothetical protein
MAVAETRVRGSAEIERDPAPGGVSDATRHRVARDDRAQALAGELRLLYPLCEREPEAARLCRLWSRSREIASGLTVEWEPVGRLIRRRGTEPVADDYEPVSILRALRGLVRITQGEEERKMVERLLARAIYELHDLWRRVPDAEEICRRWDRCEELARQLSADHRVKIVFRDPERWQASVAAGASRDQMLAQPWDVLQAAETCDASSHGGA